MNNNGESNKNTPRVAVAGIIERHDGSVLICLPKEGDDPLWEFPCGLANQGESPEAAIRRIMPECVGLHIEIHVGQPPLMGQHQGLEVEFRFFLCGVSTGEALATTYQEVRWVEKAELSRHTLSLPSQGVAEWFTASPDES